MMTNDFFFFCDDRDLATRNVLLRSVPTSDPTTLPYQCVLSDLGMARLYDFNAQYQRTRNETMSLKVRPFVVVMMPLVLSFFCC
jgi:hypothetical protein